MNFNLKDANASFFVLKVFYDKEGYSELFDIHPRLKRVGGYKATGKAIFYFFK